MIEVAGDLTSCGTGGRSSAAGVLRCGCRYTFESCETGDSICALRFEGIARECMLMMGACGRVGRSAMAIFDGGGGECGEGGRG